MKLDKVGVCSWSLQVKSIIELDGFINKLGIETVQLACGDPHHASWDEGDDMPIRAKNSSFKVTGAMLGFPGEDYTTPQTIEKLVALVILQLGQKDWNALNGVLKGFKILVLLISCCTLDLFRLIVILGERVFANFGDCESTCK